MGWPRLALRSLLVFLNENQKKYQQTDEIATQVCNFTGFTWETVRRQFRDHVGNVHGLERCAWSSNQQGVCLKILSSVLRCSTTGCASSSHGAIVAESFIEPQSSLFRLQLTRRDVRRMQTLNLQPESDAEAYVELSSASAAQVLLLNTHLAIWKLCIIKERSGGQAAGSVARLRAAPRHNVP